MHEEHGEPQHGGRDKRTALQRAVDIPAVCVFLVMRTDLNRRPSRRKRYPCQHTDSDRFFVRKPCGKRLSMVSMDIRETRCSASDLEDAAMFTPKPGYAGRDPRLSWLPELSGCHVFMVRCDTRELVVGPGWHGDDQTEFRAELERAYPGRYTEWETVDAEEVARRREADARRREADNRRFNDALNIPAPWHGNTRVSLGGLGRNSCGDGTTSASVEHVVLEGDLTAGRFRRRSGDLLCSAAVSHFGLSSHGERERTRRFRITCKACLRAAERFKVAA